ncbi:putative an1-type zinc finger protein 1 protein [Diplogelasinospora grovesii]|uniref:An1-type zinc finger protein 1 protein n=1 Tax=Diplogelasinospora grovesii TaxID=303347 RepID=A0AAN6N390_9PEZI|nr:putative an1-type zinc finger protein 1 protein [Diplogelasinospora grovesii]
MAGSSNNNSQDNNSSEETSYTMVPRTASSSANYNDASLVGSHCEMAYCNQLDFLPFFCQSCAHTFCLDHRTESAHNCAKAGAWAERRRQAQLSRPAHGEGRTLMVETADGRKKPCAAATTGLPGGCKTVIGTSLVPGVHCSNCNRDYCLKHRLKEDHNCANLTPIGARPAVLKSGVDSAKSALDKLRSWGATKKKEVAASSSGRSMASLSQKFSSSSSTGSSKTSQILALNNMKKTAKGDDKLAPEKRVYLHVEAEAETAKAKFPKGDFFYSKDWVVGRVLDAAAKSLQVQNVNNQSADERDRLRVFHVEGGRLLEFNEKVGTALVNGNTIVLLRGVGPPTPDLIEV